MTASDISKSIAGPLFNIAVNTSAALSAGMIFDKHHCQDMAIIVLIDTVFRIGITHVLSALKLPYQQTGLCGHLLFGCLTLITQPLSVKVAQTFFHAHEKWSSRQNFMSVFGYIAFSWKVNGMVKDPILMFAPHLRKNT